MRQSECQARQHHHATQQLRARRDVDDDLRVGWVHGEQQRREKRLEVCSRCVGVQAAQQTAEEQQRRDRRAAMQADAGPPEARRVQAVQPVVQSEGEDGKGTVRVVRPLGWLHVDAERVDELGTTHTSRGGSQQRQSGTRSGGTGSRHPLQQVLDNLERGM